MYYRFEYFYIENKQVRKVRKVCIRVPSTFTSKKIGLQGSQGMYTRTNMTDMTTATPTPLRLRLLVFYHHFFISSSTCKVLLSSTF